MWSSGSREWSIAAESLERSEPADVSAKLAEDLWAVLNEELGESEE